MAREKCNQTKARYVRGSTFPHSIRGADSHVLAEPPHRCIAPRLSVARELSGSDSENNNLLSHKTIVTRRKAPSGNKPKTASAEVAIAAPLKPPQVPPHRKSPPKTVGHGDDSDSSESGEETGKSNKGSDEESSSDDQRVNVASLHNEVSPRAICLSPSSLTFILFGIGTPLG